MHNARPNDFASTYERALPALVGFARSELRGYGLDDQLAEDVVQDAAVGFLAAHATHRTPEQTRAYLCRSISRRCIALLKDPWANRDEEGFLDFSRAISPRTPALEETA